MGRQSIAARVQRAVLSLTVPLLVALAVDTPAFAQSCPALDVRNPDGNYIVPGVQGGIVYAPVLNQWFGLRSDTEGSPVVLINEALAKRFFTDRDPIGGRIKPGGGPNVPFFTVVGVLKDVKQAGVAEATGTELYMLTDQLPKVAGFVPRQMNFVTRSALPVDSLTSGYRQAVASLDPTLPLIRIQSMESAFDVAIVRPRFLTLLLSIFAGLALALAAIGTYGILSYLVSQRTQEIGIRMALGADRTRILQLVMTRGLLLSAIGLALGLAGSLAATRVMGSLLFNVTPTDPITLVAVAGLIVLVAAVACLVPALRATKVDPLVALRTD